MVWLEYLLGKLGFEPSSAIRL